MFSTTKPQTVSIFFAGVITVGAEMSFHLFCLVVLLIQSVYPNVQRKSVYRPSWLSVIKFSTYQYKFRNENRVSVLLYPARNHLTVETRARRTSVSNIGFGIQRKPRRKTCTDLPDSVTSFILSAYQSFLFIMEMVFRYWYTQQEIISLQKRVLYFRLMSHHSISSSRIRYPNKARRKTRKPLPGMTTSECPVKKW